jgi:histidinol-phosphate phosphatase family protein
VESYGGQVKVIPTGVDLSTSKVVETILLREAHARPEAAPPLPSRGIVFLDRDGTVIENVPYLHEPEKVRLLPGVGEGLTRLQSAGFRLVIVTNQQGIGLGFFTPREYVAVNEALLRALAPHRVTISRIYHCPHSREEGCRCRKPAAGMLERGLLELNEHPARCFLVGDTPSDMQAAATAGIRGVGVGGSELPGASATFPDFLRAVDWILSQPAAAPLEAQHAR